MPRGAAGFSKARSYLEEVTWRTARQILTAAGAEQQVADDGPNGQLDLYLKLGRRAEAKQHYEQSLTLNPNSSRAEDVRRILQGLRPAATLTTHRWSFTCHNLPCTQFWSRRG